MGQEFFIQSEELQQKVSELLPSQGGLGAGFDLSANSQIIPIVDLTEQAQGSNVRADLQTALSFNSVTAFSVSNTTTSIIVNTGYYRIFGTYRATSTNTSLIAVSDGATNKNLLQYTAGSGDLVNIPYDINVFLPAGHSVVVISNSSTGTMSGATRQIADITGKLVDP